MYVCVNSLHFGEFILCNQIPTHAMDAYVQTLLRFVYPFIILLAPYIPSYSVKDIQVIKNNGIAFLRLPVCDFSITMIHTLSYISVTQ